MNKVLISNTVLTIMIGVIFLSIERLSTFSKKDIEFLAMASLGYVAVAKNQPYPFDKYAMPEPFSSESLITYSLKGKGGSYGINQYVQH